MVGAVVLQVANLLAAHDIEDLRAAIAARRDELTIMTEADAAHDALMRQIVHKIHIEPPRHARIEDRVPIFASALEMRWKLVRFEVRELVADALELGAGVLEVGSDLLVRVRRRRGTGDAGGTWIRVGGDLLGCGRPAKAAATETRFTWSWRSCWLRWLWVACRACQRFELAIPSRD